MTAGENDPEEYGGQPVGQFNPISDDELEDVRQFVEAGNGDNLPPDTLLRMLQRIDSDRWHLEHQDFFSAATDVMTQLAQDLRPKNAEGPFR